MSRIAHAFDELKRNGKKALVTFITAGDPDLAVTGELIPLLAESGSDIIELGVPFSDPMADGPTIQLSSERALAAGTTLPKILSTVKSARVRTQVPIVLMGYYNPILMYGLDRFAADAADAGVDGVLLVDLPPEEAGEFKACADRHGLDVIFLLTPTSDEARIRTVVRRARGFIYYVSVTGVTGARSGVETTVAGNVAAIKGKTSIPVAVGFGISSPGQAASVAASADGVVVGSAIVKLFEQHRGDDLKEAITTFVSSLKQGVDG
ncbi:tryptophan synthase subunit alpha [Geobacter benzoatilyticus]|uniref:Tryptophan synthase alpha chain n=1 Tax=Geobacter benzoatilyticus TaxID=2815309 RepID=A0ABX7Q0W8_9BACT|nr:tryptophan synthase subunit alpha [Geobacter benzoatilyticus]QSV44568.1 tryptophan synthase subunit alpha [Geobacter benzoatilyticus]